MLRIRPLLPPDLPAVTRMVHALAAHHGDRSTLNTETLRRLTEGDAPSVWLHVAERDGELLGYAALCANIQLVYARWGMDIQHLFVAQHARGQGVGKALIAACEDHAREQLCTSLTVGTHPDNTAAGQVYLAAGFVRRPPSGPRFGKRL